MSRKPGAKQEELSADGQEHLRLQDKAFDLGVRWLAL